MEELLLYKLNRTIFVSLISQRKVLDALQYYNSYIAGLNDFITTSRNKTIKNFVQEEISIAKNIFYARLSVLANEYFNNKDYANALMCFTGMCNVDISDIEMLKKYVTCLCKEQQIDLAISVLEHIDSICPNDLAVLDTLASLYEQLEDYKKAIIYKEKYLDLVGKKKAEAIDLNILGVLYNKLYDIDSKFEYIEKAIDCIKKAFSLNPKSSLYAKNLTIVATKGNLYDVAKEYWDKYFQLGNITHDDEFDYAGFCLSTKDFENWYKYFDSRFLKETNRTPFPTLNKPRWDGVVDISDSVLLVHYEQGFGDTFLTLGYVNRLAKIAKKVIFVVQHEVYELVKNSNLPIEVIDFSNQPVNLEYDYYLPSMSILTSLKLNEQTIPVESGYIVPDNNLVREFKDKYFKTKKVKIGLAIAGNSNGDLTRDIPPEKLALLGSLKNVQFYSLTKGISKDVYKYFKKNKVVDLGNTFNDFNETAAAIENLDLCISSDNGLMNLAGAMGKKTFGLFNWHYQFRWFDLSGDDTVWYKSVKPFVNSSQNNWETSIMTVKKEIERSMK